MLASGASSARGREYAMGASSPWDRLQILVLWRSRISRAVMPPTMLGSGFPSQPSRSLAWIAGPVQTISMLTLRDARIVFHVEVGNIKRLVDLMNQIIEARQEYNYPHGDNRNAGHGASMFSGRRVGLRSKDWLNDVATGHGPAMTFRYSFARPSSASLKSPTRFQ